MFSLDTRLRMIHCGNTEHPSHGFARYPHASRPTVRNLEFEVRFPTLGRLLPLPIHSRGRVLPLRDGTALPAQIQALFPSTVSVNFVAALWDKHGSLPKHAQSILLQIVQMTGNTPSETSAKTRTKRTSPHPPEQIPNTSRTHPAQIPHRSRIDPAAQIPYRPRTIGR